jgi:hypothetical protein
MPVLNIILDGDNCWPDLLEKKVIHHTGAISVAALPGGMASGKTSVSIRIDLPDGTVLIAETSLQLFASAARAFVARYGE